VTPLLIVVFVQAKAVFEDFSRVQIVFSLIVLMLMLMQLVVLFVVPSMVEIVIQLILQIVGLSLA
jgi:hypothetical protein